MFYLVSQNERTIFYQKSCCSHRVTNVEQFLLTRNFKNFQNRCGNVVGSHFVPAKDKNQSVKIK